MTTIELLKILENNNEISFDELLKQLPDLTFLNCLDSFIESSPLDKSEIIKNADIERSYAYQILRGIKLPGQDKVIRFALALKLNLHDTNLLLTLSNNKSLYPKIKRDALIIMCIKKQYSVMKTNTLLDEYGFAVLN